MDTIFIVYEWNTDAGEINRVFSTFGKATAFCRKTYKNNLRAAYENYRDEWFDRWDYEGAWANAPALLNYEEWEEALFDTDEIIQEIKID